MVESSNQVKIRALEQAPVQEYQSPDQKGKFTKDKRTSDEDAGQEYNSRQLSEALSSEKDSFLETGVDLLTPSTP